METVHKIGLVGFWDMTWREYFAAVRGYEQRNRDMFYGIMLAFHDPKALKKAYGADEYSNRSKPKDLLAKIKKVYEQQTGIPWSNRKMGEA